MAKTLQKYEGLAQLQLNGRTLAEAQDTTITVNSQISMVDTFQGRRGYSEGIVTATCSLSSAVPKAGYEHDFIANIREGSTVIVKLLQAGESRLYEMVVMSFAVTSNADSPASASIELEGKPI